MGDAGKMPLYFHSVFRMSSDTSSAGMTVGAGEASVCPAAPGPAVVLAVASASAAEVRMKASCIRSPSKSLSPPQKAAPSTSTAARVAINTLFFIQKSLMWVSLLSQVDTVSIEPDL